MGKGKGALARYCARTLQNHNLFEFIGFNLKDLVRLKKILKKKVCIPINIQGSFFLNTYYILNGNISENNFFFKKYKK